MWDTGPRMTPSADCAASKAGSGKVVPCRRSAANPIEAVANSRPRPNLRSAARRTSTVAALISGPIPSPSSTNNSTGVFVRLSFMIGSRFRRRFYHIGDFRFVFFRAARFARLSQGAAGRQPAASVSLRAGKTLREVPHERTFTGQDRNRHRRRLRRSPWSATAAPPRCALPRKAPRFSPSTAISRVSPRRSNALRPSAAKSSPINAT